MKHIKALSKTNPVTAFSLSSKSKSAKTPCDTFLKTPEEKDEKKNSSAS